MGGSVDAAIREVESRNGVTIDNMDANQSMSEVAQFDVTIARATATISEALPVPVFGAASIAAGLQEDISSYVETSSTSLVALLFGTVFQQVTGETINIVNSLANAKKLQLEYKNSSNQDIVTVTCSTTPYPSFVQSTFSDVFHLSSIRYSISDSAQTAQYSKSVTYHRRTIFGKLITNPFTPSAFRSPKDYQSTIVDIDVGLSVDKETSLWTQIVASAGLEITLSLFVSRFNKFSANQL